MRWEPDVIGKEGMVAQRREHQSENPPSKNQPQKRKKYDNPMSKTSQKPTKKKRRTIFAIGFPGRSTPGITCANTFVESYSLRRRWTKNPIPSSQSQTPSQQQPISNTEANVKDEHNQWYPQSNRFPTIPSTNRIPNQQQQQKDNRHQPATLHNLQESKSTYRLISHRIDISRRNDKDKHKQNGQE